MSEINLIAKLKALESIKPEKDFSAASKMLILNSSAETNSALGLERELGLMKSVMPSRDFAFATRQSIIESSKLTSGKLTQIFAPQRVFSQFMNYGVSLSLASILIAVIFGGMSYISRPIPIIGERDSDGLVAEAKNLLKDIDIHLEEVEYYKTAAEKATVALNEAHSDEIGHLNSRLIKRESERANLKSSSMGDADQLLNKAAF